MESRRLKVRLDRSKIAWLKWLLESSEGLALPVVTGASEGSVLLLVPPGWEEELETFLAMLGPELGLVAMVDEDAGPVGCMPEGSGGSPDRTRPAEDA